MESLMIHSKLKPFAYVLIAAILFGCTNLTTRPDRTTFKEKHDISKESAYLNTGAKTALVIGVGDYGVQTNLKPLKTPTNDAKTIAKLLQRADFKLVGGQPLLNPNQQQMKAAVEAYRAELQKNGGVGIISIDSHGTVINGENYLLPIEPYYQTHGSPMGICVSGWGCHGLLWRVFNEGI